MRHSVSAGIPANERCEHRIFCLPLHPCGGGLLSNRPCRTRVSPEGKRADGRKPAPFESAERNSRGGRWGEAWAPARFLGISAIHILCANAVLASPPEPFIIPRKLHEWTGRCRAESSAISRNCVDTTTWSSCPNLEPDQTGSEKTGRDAQEDKSMILR